MRLEVSPPASSSLYSGTANRIFKRHLLSLGGLSPARIQYGSVRLGGPTRDFQGRRRHVEPRRARWCPRWRPGLQAQVCEDPLDHRRFEDRRDDRGLAAAVRAVLEVALEYALEQPGPVDANRSGVCAAWLGGVELRRVGILVGTAASSGGPRSCAAAPAALHWWVRALRQRSAHHRCAGRRRRAPGSAGPARWSWRRCESASFAAARRSVDRTPAPVQASSQVCCVRIPCKREIERVKA